MKRHTFTLIDAYRDARREIAQLHQDVAEARAAEIHMAERLAATITELVELRATMVRADELQPKSLRIA